jgi:hypothetical protein
MYYVSQYGVRQYLFGPGEGGLVPHHLFVDELEKTGIFSLYAWSASPVFFELLFHLGIVAALAVTLGIGGRPVLALHAVLLWSLYQRQPVLMDGGDNLMHVVLPFLLLTRCYDRFSLRSPLGRNALRRIPSAVRFAGTPLHNLGVAAIALQICLVYMVSGLYKVAGKTWQDGTALFYIMRVPEFELPGLSQLVYNNDALVYVLTYSTVFFLVYFPLGVAVPALRPWAAVASISFHAGIGLFMGLTGFALTMVACDLIFLSPALARALQMIEKVRHRLAERTSKKQAVSSPAINPEPVMTTSAK